MTNNAKQDRSLCGRVAVSATLLLNYLLIDLHFIFSQSDAVPPVCHVVHPEEQQCCCFLLQSNHIFTVEFFVYVFTYSFDFIIDRLRAVNMFVIIPNDNVLSVKDASAERHVLRLDIYKGGKMNSQNNEAFWRKAQGDG